MKIEDRLYSIASISGITGIILILWNIIDFFNTEFNTLKLIYYISLLVISVIYLFLRLLIKSNKWLRFITLLIMSAIFILENPENVYGMILLLLSLLFAVKNKLFLANRFKKVLIITLSFIVVITVSFVQFKDNYKSHTIVFLIIFYLFCGAIVYFIYKSGLEFLEHKDKLLRDQIKELKESINLQNSLYSHIKTDFIDPIEAGLTDAEFYVLESLCKYKESNIDLGKRLCKSHNTIKYQLARIMDKIGADDRYQLIELCQNYFIFFEAKSAVC